MELKLEEVQREVIKPASTSTTPQNDQIQLSIFDVSSPPAYVSPIFFYNNTNNLNSENISQDLKTSLSNTLTRFYPLAGRIEGDSISCNDEGAAFTEARTDLILSDYLKTLNTDSLKELFPTTAQGESPSAWPLLSVKVTFFGSGSGVAIAVCVSHLICDASSLFTFVSDWATTTTKGKSNDHMVTNPHFASTTIYPPPHISFQVPKIDATTEFTEKCVKKRFVFESSKIKELKLKAASETVPSPTRVEAITALIWRCATKASSRFNWPSMIHQAVDLRLRIPSNVVPQDAIGNLLTFFFLKKEQGYDMELDHIVAEFRKAKEVVNEMIRESATTTMISQNMMKVTVDFLSELKQPETNLYAVTSWCKKRFYEVDFGMGGPVWVAVPDSRLYFLLMDTKDGESVEAWVGLPEQDMVVFVRDQELLAFATQNPPISI